METPPDPTPSISNDAYYVDPPRRPGKLTAVAVIAIVLGSIGVLGALQSGMALAFADRMQQAQLKSMGGGPAPMKQAIEEMYAGTTAVSERYFAVNMLLAGLGGAVSLALIGTAIGALRLHEPSRALLRYTLLFLTVFVCLRLIPAIKMQMELAPVMSQYTQALMQPPPMADEASGQPPGQAAGQAAGAQIGAAVMGFVQIFQLVVLGVWALIELVYCVIGYVYLGRPQVLEVFARAAERA